MRWAFDFNFLFTRPESRPLRVMGYPILGFDSIYFSNRFLYTRKNKLNANHIAAAVEEEKKQVSTR